ncbi:MAG: cysteine desulfurase [Gammaproteobacteria bacterium]|nr:MAG: cysteine desulfurase [Gammaproteobacteria bacterium]
MSARSECAAAPGQALDLARLRADFPILQQQINGHRLAFLDSAASAQRPAAVIEAVADYYRHDHANVHRGVHTLSHRATEAYEGARDKVRRFINAASTREIVFTRGTTEAINLVANSLGQGWSAGDNVVISHLEHHSNIVPWQMLAERVGIELRVIPIDRRGELQLDALPGLLDERSRLLSIAHVSNALGTVNPVKELVALARERGVPTLVDGAQAVPHGPVDVAAIGCDFYAFSGHKMYGPTGIGVLYGREALLAQMPPWQGGGDMILSVSFSGTTYNELPYRFEAGTPHIAGAVGLGAAVDYLAALGMQRIAAHEQQLLDYATARLAEIPGLELVGTARHKAGVLSFNIEGIHPHDLGTILDHQGVAIRTGHHCAMPVMEFFGIAGTARASLGLYNGRDDIDQLVAGLHTAIEMFR